MSRTEFVKKNIFYGYVSTIITSLFSVAARTVFVYTLGASYLGVSGLFTNVLGVLSFTELMKMVMVKCLQGWIHYLRHLT